MLDPFPIAAPKLLMSLANTLSTSLSFSTLSLHIHEIILSAIGYHLICVFLSPWISRRLFPRTYPLLPWRTKVNWDVHVVSLVQSLLINALGLYVMFYDKEREAMDWRERVWGYTGGGGLVIALATGYFAWDLLMSATHVGIFGWGLLAHALSALSVYSLGFRPFVNYYGPNFILYELSSPFLNIHWFCDKLSLTGSNTQLVNGIFLMTSFFGSRLVWGTYNSYRVFGDIWKAMDYQQTIGGRAWLEGVKWNVTAKATETFAAERGSAKAEVLVHAVPAAVPVWLACVYVGSNAVLAGLNVYWFGKMVETIRARFEPPFGTKKVQKKSEDEKAKLTGKKSRQGEKSGSDDGLVSVEVDAKEVGHRDTASRRRKG